MYRQVSGAVFVRSLSMQKVRQFSPRHHGNIIFLVNHHSKGDVSRSVGVFFLLFLVFFFLRLTPQQVCVPCASQRTRATNEEYLLF